VILTGWLDDGTAGLWAGKERGGATIVQHPDDAYAPAMPLNAIKHVEVDHIAPLKDIAPMLARMTEAPDGEEGGHPVPEEMKIEVKIARQDNALENGILK
jgi:two-component system chemotaxis response regulator CheB